jgi:hypothetical protein
MAGPSVNPNPNGLTLVESVSRGQDGLGWPRPEQVEGTFLIYEGHSERRTRLIRLGIVDDHPVFRVGLIRTLEREGDLAVLWELGSVTELFRMLDTCPVDGVDPVWWTPCRLTAIVSGITSWAAA